MSNYTFVVCDESTVSKVEPWIRAHAPSSEVHTARIGKRRHLILVSKDIDRSVRGTLFHRGTVIAADHDAIVFGAAGWEGSPVGVTGDPGGHGGEYVVAQWSDGLTVDRDVFGQARMMITEGRGYAAASDSLLVLAALRRALGDPVDPHEEALLARTVPTEIVGQQISRDTIVRGIQYVPAGRGLRLSRFACRWRVTGSSMGRRVTNGTADYVDSLREGAAHLTRTVATLIEIPDWRTSLSLSGGLDSRLVLAAAVATGRQGQLGVRVRDTGPRFAADVAAAVEVARASGAKLTIDDGKTSPHHHLPEELTLWAASLLGVYDGYGPLRSTRGHRREFGLTGMGAEILKGNWGWRTLPQLLDGLKLQDGVADATAAQIGKSLADLEAAPGLSDASELYYLGYRNGIHGSAGHIRNHMTGVHPAMQFGLARLGHIPIGGARRPRAQFTGSPDAILDLTVMLSPELASLAYDRPERNQTREQVRERVARLGGRLPTPAPLHVHGSPDDIPAGPSEFSLSIARSVGFVGPLTADTAVGRAETALDLLDDGPVRAAYVGVYENALWRMEKFSRTLKDTGVSMPRVSMLDIFRLRS